MARWRAGSLAGWLAGWQVTGLCYSVQESSRQRFPRGGRLALQLVELRQALRSPIPFDRFPQQRQRHVRPPHLARCTTAQSRTGRRSAAMSGGAGYRSASCCPSSSPSGSGTIDRNPHRHPGFGAAPNARGVVRATRPFADAGWLAGGPPRDSAGWLAGPPKERWRNRPLVGRQMEPAGHGAGWLAGKSPRFAFWPAVSAPRRATGSGLSAAAAVALRLVDLRQGRSRGFCPRAVATGRLAAGPTATLRPLPAASGRRDRTGRTIVGLCPRASLARNSFRAPPPYARHDHPPMLAVWPAAKQRIWLAAQARLRNAGVAGLLVGRRAGGCRPEGWLARWPAGWSPSFAVWPAVFCAQKSRRQRF